MVVSNGEEHSAIENEILAKVFAPHGVVLKLLATDTIILVIVVVDVVHNHNFIVGLANGAFRVGMQLSQSEVAESADFIMVTRCDSRCCYVLVIAAVASQIGIADQTVRLLLPL